MISFLEVLRDACGLLENTFGEFDEIGGAFGIPIGVVGHDWCKRGVLGCSAQLECILREKESETQFLGD